MSSGLSILVYVVYEEGYFDYFSVFDGDVWAVLICSLLVCSLFFWVYEKDSKTKYNLKLTILENILGSMFNTFEIIFSIIEKPVKTISARILMVGLLIFVAFFSNFYIAFQIRKIENKISKALCYNFKKNKIFRSYFWSFRDLRQENTDK